MSSGEHELVIVGAGPAGVSAALWARARNLEPLLLEAGDAPGGQLALVHFHPREHLGWLAGDGPALAQAIARQVAEERIALRTSCRVEAFEPGEGLALRLAGGERIVARAVIVATGARRRRLDVPGERELEGRGVSFSATHDRDALAGRTAVVVGGGDAAFENALLLADAGGTITILARAEARARREFRERVAAEPRIMVREHARVVAVLGDAHVRGVRVGEEAGEHEIACEAVVVKIGVVPNTEWCAGALERDAEGWVRVDGSYATSRRGVWAAGDVVRPELLGVAVAAGHGALAVAAIRAALRGA
jgi:thioredoxin reductase (NADPH)